MSTTNQYAYADDEIFSYENGLNIAVAFTAYNNEEEWELDERYGELFFIEYSWGENSDGSNYLNRDRLDAEVCTAEQLGLTENRENTEFMPVNIASVSQVTKYRKKFLCAKKEDM